MPSDTDRTPTDTSATDSRSRLGDKVLTPDEEFRVKTNAVWVVAQVLGHRDPNFNVAEFAREAGVHGPLRPRPRERYPP
jgi:hypothetical protein